MKDFNLTLLSVDDIFSNFKTFQKYGRCSALTDMAIVTGAAIKKTDERVRDDKSLKGRLGYYFLKNNLNDNGVLRSGGIEGFGRCFKWSHKQQTIRPVLEHKGIVESHFEKELYGMDVVLFGTYPQYAASCLLQKELEENFQNNKLKKTGRKFNFSLDENDYCYEYDYNNKKYIRYVINNKDIRSVVLSNNLSYTNNDYVWIEVSPVEWFLEDNSLLSKKELLAGIVFTEDDEYNGNFDNTLIKEFLDKYMLKDLLYEYNKENSNEISLDEVNVKGVINSIIECNIPLNINDDNNLDLLNSYKNVILIDHNLNEFEIRKLLNKSNVRSNELFILYFKDIEFYNSLINSKYKLGKNIRYVTNSRFNNNPSFININIHDEDLVEWASSKNIHPLIFNYLKDNNIKNIDYNKWENLSNVLYNTPDVKSAFFILESEIYDNFINYCEKAKVLEKK